MTNETHHPDADLLAAYTSGGLTADDRARIERDPRLAAELAELQAFDASLQQSAGVDPIVAGLEDRLAAAVEAAQPAQPRVMNPIVRRAALATAACLILGTTGYFATTAMEGGNLSAVFPGSRFDRRSVAQYSSIAKVQEAPLEASERSGLAATEKLRVPNEAFESPRGEASKDNLGYLKGVEGTSGPAQSAGWFKPSEFGLVGGHNGRTTGAVKDNARPADINGTGVLYADGHAEYQPGTTTVNGTLILGGQILAMGDADGDGKLGPPATQPAGPAAVAATGRKVIRSGEVQYEVDRFDSAATTITKIVADERGVIATINSDKLPNGKVRGQIIVRVPPDRLDALILQLRGLGDLKSQRLGSSDVSKEYADLESELRAARAMEGRLLEMIKTGKGEIKDLLAAEKELANWRGKIEKIIGQQQYYDNLVSLATLTITLTERDIATPAAAVESENISAGIETDDVEKARTAALEALKDAKARIVSSDLKKLDAGQMAATIVADIPPDAAGPVVDRIKQLGKVARLEAQRSMTADSSAPIATATPKLERRGSRLMLSLYNVANVAPRQSSTLSLVTADVDATYRAIVAKVIKAGGRVVRGGATQSQPTTSAQAQVEVPDGVAEAFLLELKALGDVVSLATTENPDTANVTTSKRGFTMSIVAPAALPARQTTSLSVQGGDVEQAAARLSATVVQVGGRVIDSQSSTDTAGQSATSLKLDVPLGKAAEVIAAARGAGAVQSVTSNQDPNAPAGTLARARIDVTFTSQGALVGDSGLMANVRNGLAISARGLVFSAQMIVVGLCFVLPWALIVWAAAKLIKRRKVTAPTS